MNAFLPAFQPRRSGRIIVRGLWSFAAASFFALSFGGQAALPQNRDTTFQTPAMDGLPMIDTGEPDVPPTLVERRQSAVATPAAAPS